MNREPDIDKIYLYARFIYLYLYEPKYQLLINKRESTDLKYINDLKIFFSCFYDTILFGCSKK